MQRVDDVVCAVLGFIGMLSRLSPDAAIFNELRDVAALRFRFAEEVMKHL